MKTSSPEISREALQACHEIFRRHARTFSLAAKLFPSAVRDDAAVVYAFCRTADDAVDGVMDPALASERLSRVSESLARVLRSGRTLKICAADVHARKNGQEVHCATMLATIMCLPGKSDRAG